MLSSYRPDDQLVNSVQIHWPKASFFETNEDPAQTNITFWLQSPMYQHVRVRWVKDSSTVLKNKPVFMSFRNLMPGIERKNKVHCGAFCCILNLEREMQQNAYCKINFHKAKFHK